MRDLTTTIAAAFVCGLSASAQVSTFTADGGGPVLLAPRVERPASRVYLGPAFVNVHQDVAPGIADALAPPLDAPRTAPLRYGASPTLTDLRVPTNLGPTVVYFDPWTPIEGRGDLRTLEAARVDFLERYGLLGGVRTHENTAGMVLDRVVLEEEFIDPRGVIRVRPASPRVHDGFVRAEPSAPTTTD